ncbi:sugar phosphate isomerase/epimerase [bacterium]|nr:MAG: sugar phosphate isomerase/epimerase [bacterium]
MPAPLSIGTTLGLSGDLDAAFAPLRELQIPTAQIFPPASLDAEATRAAAEKAGVEITSIIAHFSGENYADIPTVERTVGLVPEMTRPERLAHLMELAAFARAVGVRQLQTHIGFVPEDANDPRYVPVVQMTQEICDDLAQDACVFALETGQETAATLLRFLKDVKRPNLLLNFDPANMILYGHDEPTHALELLYPYIQSIHAKDGIWPTEPNQLGSETPLGEGDVNWPQFGARLLELGYKGTLTIEREIGGPQKWVDVAKAKTWLEELVSNNQ